MKRLLAFYFVKRYFIDEKRFCTPSNAANFLKLCDKKAPLELTRRDKFVILGFTCFSLATIITRNILTSR